MQNWWLDAVCDEWQLAVSRGENEQIRGVFPYFLNKKYGFLQISLPPLTPWLGLWLDVPTAPPAKLHTVYSFEKEVIGELLAGLPSVAFFDLNLDASFQNGLPFQQNGYRQTTRFSYVLENLDDFAAVDKGFNRNVRRNLLKAETRLRVVETDDLDVLFSLSKKTFERRGERVPFSLELLRRVDNSLKINAFRQIWLTENQANGQPVAAIYVAWNAHEAHLLITASEANFEGAASTFPLFETALRFLSGKTRRFDFNGSMTESVAATYRSFGATQRAYSRFFRAKNRWLEAAKILFEK